MENQKRDFDKAAASWDQELKRVKLASDIAEAIKGEILLDREMDILDFGCGTGLLTLRLQPLARSVTGADSSQGMLDVLQSKISKEGIRNVYAKYIDLDKGDILEGDYHLITSSMTLHHVRDIQPLLNRFYEITRPSGHLCIADLDPDDGQFHGDNNVGVFHKGFERSAMREAFKKAGYVNIRDLTAASMVKPVKGGGNRKFTIFLVTGCKSERQEP